MDKFGKDDRVAGRLGIISDVFVCRHETGIYVHLSFGRVVDRIAARYEKVVLCVPLKDGPPEVSCDYRLQARNVEAVPQPFYSTMLGSLRHLGGILRAYIRTCRVSDVLFVRGMPPCIGLLYLSARWWRRKVCLWVVGDPVRVLRANERKGKMTDVFSLIYAYWDRASARFGRWLTNGSFICNGKELGEIFPSPYTTVVVSSTIRDDEFSERPNTCQGPVIRVLFVSFIRPEKGVEYLLEAMVHVQANRPWELVLVGASNNFPDYRKKLDGIIERFGIRDRIRWAGYVTYGPAMFEYFRQADVFVLPTLSEGTPRVLVEARANSLPVVATNVGGIPTSVTDGVDGLLVRPKDSVALARAISRIIADEALRRSLINNGLRSARRLTVDKFVELVIQQLRRGNERP